MQWMGRQHAVLVYSEGPRRDTVNAMMIAPPINLSGTGFCVVAGMTCCTDTSVRLKEMMKFGTLT